MTTPAYHTYEDALAGVTAYLRAGAEMLARCKVWQEHGYIRANMIENAELALDEWFKDIGEPPMDWALVQRDIRVALEAAEAALERPAVKRAAMPIAAE